MNIPKSIALTVGLMLAATTLPAQGFGPRMGGGALCGARAFDLTEAQQATLKTITERHQSALEAKQKVADEAREAKRKAMHDPAVSDAKVAELQAKVSEAMTAVMLERRAMMREFEAILTPDQKAALDKQRSQGGRRGMGRGMGMGRGRGRGFMGCF